MHIVHAAPAIVHHIDTPDLLGYRTYTQFNGGQIVADEPTEADRMWKLSYDLHYQLPYGEWPAMPACISGELAEAWESGRDWAQQQIEADMDAAWEQESLERYDHDLSNYYAIICD